VSASSPTAYTPPTPTNSAGAAQGYQGFLLLDQGDDKRLAILLYDSAAAARAAQGVAGPIAHEYIYALLASPTQGSLGTVVVGDGVFAAPTQP